MTYSETVEIFISESLAFVFGLPPGTTTLVTKVIAGDDETEGRTYRCGLCGTENDHYKTTCPDRFCSNCECEDPDCGKYDDLACECCV